jgi:hypothetical protein
MVITTGASAAGDVCALSRRASVAAGNSKSMPRRAAGYQFLYIHAPQMHPGQFGSHFSQSGLAWSDLVTESATEFPKTGCLLSLLVRPPVFRSLRDPIHVRKQANAPFKIARHLLPSGSEAEFAVLAHGVAVVAAVLFKHIPGKLLLGFVGGDHLVQGRSRFASGGLGLRSCLWEAEQNRN